MNLITLSETWGSSPEEREAHYPCDNLARGSAFFRAIDVHAPVSKTFRWLCQLKVAPYSYDWLDNYGKQSPRALVAGLDELSAGQRVMSIFKLVSFEHDDHITIQIASPQARKLFGDMTVTYRVMPTNLGSRIVVKIIFTNRGRLWYHFFAFGDLIMMRKQLITLKQLAES
jgi:hypothetical protein